MAATACFRSFLHRSADNKIRGISRMLTKLLPGIVAPILSCWLKQIRCDARTKCLQPDTKSSAKTSDLHYDIPKSLAWIPTHQTTFPIDGDNVTVLNSPNEFYETMLAQTRKARSRITIASLYLGTGHLEQKLVSEIQNTLDRHDTHVELLILLDHTRGLRGHPNSCTMLQPLLQNQRANVALFHTPRLRGILKQLAPDRWNELLGLQHMKVFIFDDNLLISGANLSNDYFTNRQDRYLLFENCPELAQHIHNLVTAVASFSLQLDSNGERRLHPSWSVHPFEGDEAEFKAKCRQTIAAVLSKGEKGKNAELYDCDTLVTPLVQLGSMGISQDENFTKRLLITTPENACVVMATGYFNLTDDYKNVILNCTSAPVSIVMASPKVNGFYKAGGVAGAIPSAYTNLAKEFYEQVLQQAQNHRIRLAEYERDRWTFHSKGLWMYLAKEETPFLTLIGSPNFGHRSVYRDLELQFSVMTTNKRLRDQLHKEQEDISKRSLPVIPTTFSASDRSVPLWVRLVTRFYRDFF